MAILLNKLETRTTTRRNSLFFLLLFVLINVRLFGYMINDAIASRATNQGQRQQTKYDASMNPMLLRSDNVSIWGEIAGWFHAPSSSWDNKTTSPAYSPCTTEVGINDEKYDPFWLTVSPKLNVAITFIPKIMCSSIRFAMRKIEECNKKYSRCFPDARLNPKWRNNLHLMDGMTRVLVLRDPIERALSAYANSQINPYIFTDSCNSSDTCSFEQWVGDLYQHGIAWRRYNHGGQRSSGVNEHFFTQVSIAQLDAIHYHYILRMSSPIDQDFFWNKLLQGAIESKEERIFNSSSNKTEDTLMNRTERRQKAEIIYAGLSRKTLEQLHSLYHEDFDLWETILQRGTPRTPDEITVYDIYKADMAKWPKKI